FTMNRPRYLLYATSGLIAASTAATSVDNLCHSPSIKISRRTILRFAGDRIPLTDDPPEAPCRLEESVKFSSTCCLDISYIWMCVSVFTNKLYHTRMDFVLHLF